MNTWMTLGTLAMTLTTLVMIAIFFMSLRKMNDREKQSTFECGFDPKKNARTPFSMRFFLLAIIFIIFDIEIVLLMPTPLMTNLNSIKASITITVFLMILIMGLLHEWAEGSLSWSS